MTSDTQQTVWTIKPSKIPPFSSFQIEKGGPTLTHADARMQPTPLHITDKDKANCCWEREREFTTIYYYSGAEEIFSRSEIKRCNKKIKRFAFKYNQAVKRRPASVWASHGTYWKCDFAFSVCQSLRLKELIIINSALYIEQTKSIFWKRPDNYFSKKQGASAFSCKKVPCKSLVEISYIWSFSYSFIWGNKIQTVSWGRLSSYSAFF